MIFRRSTLLWVLLAVIAACGGAWLARELHRSEPQLASGTWLSPAHPIAEFSATDQNGRPFTRGSLLGHPTLVFFGFTHCPEVCPTTLATLAQVNRAAGVKGMRVLLVTVDPGRDTPVVLKRYLQAFDPQFLGATGTPAQIDALTKEFSVAARRIDLPDGDYMMDHSVAVFLLDERARRVAVFTAPFEVPRMAADLRLASAY